METEIRHAQTEKNYFLPGITYRPRQAKRNLQNLQTGRESKAISAKNFTNAYWILLKIYE